MPAAFWDTYRVGARIASLDRLVNQEGAEQLGRLQRALSSVAYIEPSAPSIATQPASTDDAFIGRLLLGLLSRGWPTVCSPAVEHSLLSTISADAGIAIGKANVGDASGEQVEEAWLEIKGGSGSSESWNDRLRQATLRGDRRLEVDDAVLFRLTDSQAERDFYNDHLVPLLGPAIGWLELQRPIASMIREDAPDESKIGSGRVDFSLQLPRSDGGDVKFVIELDGPHHRKPGQQRVDESRDDLLNGHGWSTDRVPEGPLDLVAVRRLGGKLEAIVRGNPFPFSDIATDVSVLDDPCGREATRLVLTPHAVARVQLALCRGLLDGALRLDRREWVLAIVEREVPCAELAVRDWLATLTHLCQLYDVEIHLQTIRLLVSEDHLADFVPTTWDGEKGSPTHATVECLPFASDVDRIDLAIDVSVGAHPTQRYPLNPIRDLRVPILKSVALRTAQRQSGYAVDPWPAPRVISDPRMNEPSLVHFLRLLFRKWDFRPGQIEIIERVLRRQDVIGLLPTGAGKSITFQLPALLSPGLALVIDPLKSLMQDQAENLAHVGIMDAIQINSDTAKKERECIEWQFSQGEFRLIFISPERLQIEDFRSLLSATAGKRPISYVVIDEAHCVSEWGHDFRTAYLNLGRIARTHCGINGVRPPMVAVTGTASESVLRDIQRELEIVGEDAIIRPSNFARKELNFEIYRIDKRGKPNELLQLLTSEIPRKLGISPGELRDGAHGGIVFCPHVNGELGVYDVAGMIASRWTSGDAPGEAGNSNSKCPVGFYSGEAPKKANLTPTEWAKRKAQAQRDFKSGKLTVLAATSAFGMGIDKPNIRYTVHYAAAKSVEAFAQEAGRAGRDRKDAICAVLFTDRFGLKSAAGENPPLDCLESGITVEEACKRALLPGWGSDDAELQMYLHTRGYQGAARESAAVRTFYHEWLEPQLGKTDQVTEVTVDERQFRNRIAQLLQPDGSNAETMAVVTNENQAGVQANPNGQGELPTPELQRLVYRLSLLGIVEDYTVRYGGFGDVYSLSVRNVDRPGVEARLRQYAARYLTPEKMQIVDETPERVPILDERLAQCELADPICCCIDTLIWFVYEEIENRRRQAMRNMREMLRASRDGADLARRINETLSNEALTRDVFDVIFQSDTGEWERISQQVRTRDSARLVYHQCRRALEDAPGHSGLLLTIGIAQQAFESTRRDEIVTNLRDGLRAARRSYPRDEQKRIAGWLIRELRRVSPGSATPRLQEILMTDQDPVLADVVLRSVPNSEESAALLEVSERCVLKSIDARLGQFMKG